MSIFFHMLIIIIWNSSLDCHSRSSFNNANQSASDSIILEYLLRPVLHAMCMYARRKHIFSIVLFTRFYHSGDWTFVLRRGTECSLILCWSKFKVWIFLWLGAILKLGRASIKGKQHTGIWSEAVRYFTWWICWRESSSGLEKGLLAFVLHHFSPLMQWPKWGFFSKVFIWSEILALCSL